eukprot:PhM_4_TR10431/c0_g1_i1/m.70537/K15731/CTDSP; carboxy-terminal domain RNA polymerase II polypeptide A small phosphatase
MSSTKESVKSFFSRFGATLRRTSSNVQKHQTKTVEVVQQQVVVDDATTSCDSPPTTRNTPSPTQSIMTQVAKGAEPTKPLNINMGELKKKRQLAASGRPSMLPSPAPAMAGRPTLVLDIDETLCHSSFRPVGPTHITLPIVVDGQNYTVHVKLRPHVHEFLEFVGQRFEVVIFTASLSQYANALMDRLDPTGAVLGPHRLFREHCSPVNGALVKDLSLLGRDLSRVLIIDNSTVATMFQPRNAINCTSWFEDPRDTELKDLMPWLDRIAAACSPGGAGNASGEGVYTILDDFHRRQQQMTEAC